MMRVNMRFDRGSSKQVASELARITDKEISFVPNNSRERFNLDAKDAPLWDVLETLSESGKLRIGGEDFSSLQAVRRALVSGERMRVCIHGASIQSVVDEFAGMSGLPIHITSGDPATVVTITVEGATLEEAMAQVSDQTGVQIAMW